MPTRSLEQYTATESMFIIPMFNGLENSQHKRCFSRAHHRIVECTAKGRRRLRRAFRFRASEEAFIVGATENTIYQEEFGLRRRELMSAIGAGLP